jgi:hypothetical protein
MSVSDRAITTPAAANLTASLAPTEIEAGGALALSVHLNCDPPADLTGRQAAVIDEAGEQITSLAFTRFDGATNWADDRTFNAPDQAGRYCWTVRVPAYSANRLSYPAMTSEVSFTVHPNKIRVLVWDVPATLLQGEHFAVKIGVKSSGATSLGGTPLQVVDETGVTAAYGVVGEALWPGSAGLTFTEVHLSAPIIGRSRSRRR